MPESLEQAALSGSLFHSQSQSPTRSASTASWHNTDDELGSDLSRPASPMASRGAPMGYTSSSSSGRPQTGPKGVVEDQREALRLEHAENQMSAMAIANYTQTHAITTQTISEEDKSRAEEQKLCEAQQAAEENDIRMRRRRCRIEELKKERDNEHFSGRRGGLKEVGKDGFVQAVERPGWVVVLIYEPHIPRCQDLLSSMLELSLRLSRSALLETPVSLLHAKATNLSFSLLPQADGVDDEESVQADPDVLPSLLAYKDGSLVETWIRVDWEIQGEEGVEGLLKRAGVMSRTFVTVEDSSEDDS